MIVFSRLRHFRFRDFLQVKVLPRAFKCPKDITYYFKQVRPSALPSSVLLNVLAES